jgi:pyruvate-formate lyase-activating enzyme
MLATGFTSSSCFATLSWRRSPEPGTLLPVGARPAAPLSCRDSMLNRPELRLRIVENKAETLSIAIRRRGEIFLKLSRASNNRCRFCNDAPFQDGTFWPFDALVGMIDEGLSRGVRRVFLSGGEPTIHPKFLDVIAYAKKKGAERIICITNGRMFSYPEFAHKAVALGLNEAFVALLAADAGTHDYLTQVEGSFEQTKLGIENLLATGNCRVSLSTVVTRINMAALTEIMTLVPGVTGLTAVRLSPAGRALFESLEELGFEVEQARPHIARAFAVAAERGLSFTPKLFPADFFEGHEAEYGHHEEYLPEIKDTELRTGLFGRFAREGEEIACRGETCRVCFRRPFCDALYAFRKRLLEGSHPFVRCDLDDARQRQLLPSLLGERALWVRSKRADSAAAALAELGIVRVPEILESERRGDGPAPRARTLILLDDPGCEPASSPEQLGVSVGALPRVSDVTGAVRFVYVPTHERMRDQEVLPLDSLRAQDLPVSGLPVCLAPRPWPLPRCEDVLDLVAVAGPQELDVVGFTHHYLRNLHRVKSERCRTCENDAACAGLHVNQARSLGLGCLVPQTAARAEVIRPASERPRGGRGIAS